MHSDLPPLTEAAFQRQILELAHHCGWTYCYHTHDSRHSASGFPDLCLCRPRTASLLFLEVKRENGRLTMEQEGWLAALTAAGQVARVVRPSQWREVEALLL